MKQSRSYKHVSYALIGLFLKRLPPIWTSSQTVTSYISFCEGSYQNLFNIHNNDKPRFTAKLCKKLQNSFARPKRMPTGKEIVLYNQARNALNKKIRAAKKSYAKKLEDNFTSRNTVSEWKGLKDITNYKAPSSSTEVNQQLVEGLNEFYCRFEIPPHQFWPSPLTTINTSSKPPLPHTCALHQQRRHVELSVRTKEERQQAQTALNQPV